jgi:hypothetical protein
VGTASHLVLAVLRRLSEGQVGAQEELVEADLPHLVEQVLLELSGPVHLGGLDLLLHLLHHVVLQPADEHGRVLLEVLGVNLERHAAPVVEGRDGVVLVDVHPSEQVLPIHELRCPVRQRLLPDGIVEHGPQVELEVVLVVVHPASDLKLGAVLPELTLRGGGVLVVAGSGCCDLLQG